MSNDLHDGFVAGGLITAPAWASWFSQFNELLTTALLFVGLLLGLARLWRLMKRRQDTKQR